MNERICRLLLGRLKTMYVTASILGCGCSLIASQKSADQCLSDRDCASLSGMVCDPIQRVCIPATGPAMPDAALGDATSEGGTCWASRGDASCFTCRAQMQSELLNACSAGGCEPFSNGERIAGFEVGQPLRPPIAVPDPIPEAGAPSDAGAGADAGDAGRPPSTLARCNDLVPPPLYLMASSAFNLILKTFAQALASEVTLVYKYDTSCPSLDSILTGDTKIRGTAVYWAGDRQLECEVEQPTQAQIC